MVVLYTAGYRYHADSHKIVQTGVISVSSIPRGADVYVDGVLAQERTPSVIGNVMPGTHKIRVEKADYSSWEKTLDVYSKQTTFAREVVLFLQDAHEPVDPSLAIKPISTEREWQTNHKEFSVQQANDRSVLSRMDENQIASIIAYVPIGIYALEEAPTPYVLMHDQERGRIILIDSKDTTQPILLNTEAKQWAWSKTGDALLFSNGFDIEVYTPSSHTLQTITRISQPIVGLTWYPLGLVALFATGGDVYAYELDRRGEPNKTTLVEGLAVSDFWIEQDGTWLVGLLKNGEGFRKRLQR